MYNQLFKLQEEIFKALAHSRRLEIIHLLRHQQLTVSEIYKMLDLPQANVSQHLHVLKEQGIVKAKKIGKQVSYQVADPSYLKLADIVRELLTAKYSEDLDVDLAKIVPLVSDPVCGMRVSSKTAGFVHQHQGKTHYFCASGCLEKFKKNPQKYS